MSGDIVFTYRDTVGCNVSQNLCWADRINSRESPGVWHVGAKAWKVTAQYQAISNDYHRAAIDAGLSMGSSVQPYYRIGDREVLVAYCCVVQSCIE